MVIQTICDRGNGASELVSILEEISGSREVVGN